MKRPVLLILLWFGSLLVPTFAQPASQKSWMLGPFVKQNAVNPILSANPITTFDCPVRHETVRWEEKDVYNPTAVVRNNKVYLLYRAEDTVRRVGGTSRLGLAISSDGMHFSRMPKPVFYPNNDAMKTYEWEGGCEDPRVVESPNGVYVMTYTAYDGKLARLCVATSRNLTDWQKQGLAFGNFDNGKYRNAWSKSGAIVCKRVGNRMVAQRINGTYWMYWGDKPDLRLAVSTDLLHWTPLETESSEGPLRPVRRSGTGRSDTGTPGVAGGKPIPAAESRRGTHDVRLIEPGPYALLTPAGILLIYNGMNNAKTGDPNLPDGAYSGGQLLFDAHNPTRLLDRSDTYFIRPDQPYEIEGQVNQVVFLEGMVPFRGRWFLYYGTADSKIGVATAKQ